MVELRQVRKSYGDPKGPDYIEVLRGIDLTIGPGQMMAIMGPSGSGKTTLLNLIGTIDLPTSGQILWDSQDIATLSHQQRAAFRNQYIGFIFQMHHLLPQCTALENVLLPTLARPRSNDRVTVARAKELLVRVGLGGHFNKKPGQLSGGQRQKVAVARSLINVPRLVLADEPTGSLDQDSAQAISELLLELNRQDGLALVVVTHAQSIATRFGQVYVLRSGVLTRQSP